jgi:hypothetical protein
MDDDRPGRAVLSAKRHGDGGYPAFCGYCDHLDHETGRCPVCWTEGGPLVCRASLERQSRQEEDRLRRIGQRDGVTG